MAFRYQGSQSTVGAAVAGGLLPMRLAQMLSKPPAPAPCWHGLWSVLFFHLQPLRTLSWFRGVDEVPAERLWVHDQHDTASALVLASLASPQFPVPVGVLAQVEAPIYEDLIADQEKRAVSERGPGDIARLLTSGDTWTIR